MDDRSRSCILRVDEVYVKQSASYCGREMFDFATDNPEKKSKNFAKDHDWFKIATEMRPTSMRREKQLTVMTADAITWTCESLQSLAHFLFTTDEPCEHKSV
ncbi:hypothetical protein RRG08_025129 [Elysia crispata]|uniref:Uncharacterized protein n=1 Tax=Elysia crispata TaxID=231223 RepID=A0AAE0ZVN6_9GAST|nr:hypothetical protein RRG08_025129 [Elysia crispata]